MFPWPQKLLSASQKAKLSQLLFPSVPSALEDCFGSDKLCLIWKVKIKKQSIGIQNIHIHT